ncbi:glutamine synthetase family protein [Pseudonocardia kujensis]|uniref:glutamine synthetase family protein n=1 Tax=Pseudonocardia kujensis TaxID=1128675 RepID=UPI001E4FB31E|nr:glutamine synthetase family protein [Pseudonocardia kujensis]MCE0768469.1 glutamine synthetase family protein [Pseudonocardia kujensis]
MDTGQLDLAHREERAARARSLAERMAAEQIAAVALTFVDTAGITRVKGVPLAAFEHAAAWGVGATPVFDAFGHDDSIAATPVANPTGDLRLLPDLDRVVALAAQPGWAWAPADRWTQEGEPHPGCARLLAARTVDRLAAAGLTARSAFEVEWVVYRDGEDGPEPAATGPAYGMTRLVELSDYGVDLLRALAAEGVDVRQFHPEYSPSQFELSVAPEAPVAAADTAVLVRATIRAVAARHGLTVSFAPSVADPGVGNGGHLHLSLSRDGHNVFAGGTGRFGLTPEAEAFTAGILRRLPALLAVGAPSVASYLRLLPSHWAGAYACWGRENREAAVRLVTGSQGEESTAANVEIKCMDQAANPYLLVAGLLAAGLAGLQENGTLPEPVHADPAGLSDDERARLAVERLPTDLATAAAAFETEQALTAAFGPSLTETLLAVRRAEADAFAGRTAAEIIDATRWRW